MAKVKDNYVLKLNEIISEMEKVYGLTAENNMGIAYFKLDIEDVIEYASNNVKGLPKEEIYKRNKEAGKSVVLLAYLSGRLRFFHKAKLDYSTYPHMDVVAEVLLSFLEKRTISEYNYRQLNKVIIVLSKVDQKLVNHRFGLGYRYLRIFLIMVLYSSYSNASIVASFILDQFIVKEA